MRDLDKQVLAAIESGAAVTSNAVLWHLRHKDYDVGYRQIDKALQRLRKGQYIHYEKKRWWSRRL
jgi:hypothetical protein